MFHAHNHVLALALEQPFVTAARGFIHGGRQLFSAAGQLGEFLLQIFLTRVQLADLIINQFFCGGGFGGRGHDIFLRDFGLFHQDYFCVFDFEDDFLGHLDLVGERLVFLVLARLQLLVQIFFDLRLLRLNFEVALFALGFDLFDAGLGGFQRGLGVGGLRFQPLYVY